MKPQNLVINLNVCGKHAFSLPLCIWTPAAVVEMGSSYGMLLSSQTLRSLGSDSVILLKVKDSRTPAPR